MTLWNGVEATDEQQKKVLWIVMGQNQNRPFGPLSIQFTIMYCYKLQWARVSSAVAGENHSTTD